MSAAQPPVVSPDPETMDHFVYLRGVSFREYEAVLAMRGESSVPRITYLEGLLELMTPSRYRETDKKLRDESYAELPHSELLDELASADGSVTALHPAWRDELVRRVKSLKDGSAELYDWEDVKCELDEIVGD